MQQAFIILSSISVLISYGIYEWAMVKGKAKPHRTTTFILMILAILGATSLFALEDRVAFWLLFFCAIQSVVTFFMSIKYGMGLRGGTRKGLITDILCLAIAVAGIIIWQVTDRPALGLYSAIIADFVGTVPTLIKTYRLPDTEYWPSYIFGILAASLTLVAIQDWNFANFSYPAYWVFIDGAVLFLIFRPKLLKSIQT